MLLQLCNMFSCVSKFVCIFFALCYLQLDELSEQVAALQRQVTGMTTNNGSMLHPEAPFNCDCAPHVTFKFAFRGNNSLYHTTETEVITAYITLLRLR